MAEGEDQPTSLHTDSQEPDDPAKLSQAITEAIAQLQIAFPNQPVRAINWNNDYVAVPIEVAVALPTRGPVDGIDIRAREPIFLLLHRQRFPFQAPYAYSNRKDFPKSGLPHLNPTKPGRAASFCVHRGNINTWFAEHGIIDFVDRVRFWLRDAARGQLVPDRDSFEPTRPLDTAGHAVFDSAEFLTTIAAAHAETNGAPGHRLVWYQLLDKAGKLAIAMSGYTVRSMGILQLDSAATLLPGVIAFNELAKDEKYKNLFNRLLFGVLVWGNPDRVIGEYFSELPDTLGGLLAWTDRLGIDLKLALEAYLNCGFHLLSGIPITIAVRRPRRLIGASCDIELITFVVTAGGDHWPKDGAWDLAAQVEVMDHRTPLTQTFARNLSGHGRDASCGKILLLGCGALGSKFGLHFGRSGQTELTLVDPARLSPHNMVRHALAGPQIGSYKSEALRDEIVGLYPGETAETLAVAASTADAFDYLHGQDRPAIDDHQHLVDATASVQVFNMLVDSDLPAELSVARIEIADRGRIGLLSLEGQGRRPRLDDLQAALFDSAINDDDVSRWLVETQQARESQVGSGLEDIQIGLSCDSTTLRLADETVSLHAAALTRRLRLPLMRQRPQLSSDGTLFLSKLNDDGGIHSVEKTIAPVDVVTARNDPQWAVRFAGGLVEQMKVALRRARPSETGGLLVGMINRKRRIIYVTRLLDAPQDSEGTPATFLRGVQDLPAAVRNIEQRTGGLVGYIGEWHSHPAGGPDLSITDLKAVVHLKRSLDRVPMPTVVVVVTQRDAYAHVFESGTDILRVRGTIRSLLEAH